MKRRLRGIKVKSRPIRITSRDMDLLLLVGLTRTISAEQLAREFFPTADRCRRRLRRLFDTGYIRVTLFSSNQPSLVSLSRSGLALVESSWPDLATGLHLPGAISLAGVPHHLAVVDVRLYLAALVESEGGRLLAFESGKGRLARELRLNAYHLVPDALAELQIGNDGFVIGSEVDCGTEGLRALQAKLTKYRDLFNQGELEELWVIVVGNEVRQRSLVELVVKAKLADVTRVMNVNHLTLRPVRKPGQRVSGWAGAGGAGETRDEVPYSPSSSTLFRLSNSKLVARYPDADRTAERLG